MPVAIVGIVVGTARTARAQTVSQGSYLNLSPGSQVNFGFYAKNTPNSDQLQLSGALTYSSAGTIDLGFSDNGGGLAGGDVFTLITFQSTNFTSTSNLQAVATGDLTSVAGNFILTQPNDGLPGTLQFQLTSFGEMPEPGSLPLLFAGGAIAVAAAAYQARTYWTGAGTSCRSSFAARDGQ